MLLIYKTSKKIKKQLKNNWYVTNIVPILMILILIFGYYIFLSLVAKLIIYILVEI